MLKLAGRLDQISMAESKISRRAVLGGALALIPALEARAAGSWNQFAALEKSSGARIGVAAINTANGRTIFYREFERFLMCSSFKLSLAASVLARADSGQEQLDRMVRYQQSELLDVSPITSKNVATGMPVEELCRAAVCYSDNTAANLLLASVGGPAGVTGFWRSLRDESSRLDRSEPLLNTPDGDKDTTTPVAMLGTLKTMIASDALKPGSREKLQDWMIANTTGDLMLRAGLPKNWTVGDKTGRYAQTGATSNAAADLAIATPPGGSPIFITAFSRNANGDDIARQAVLADIGRIIAAEFTQTS
jgi:beta-lactamase class A